ncbi:Putative CRISPR type III-B/RAMP module RAMP protein Cmr5 [Desulfonema limicola]|uniref:CRISPR type III-B/RAMP module-associated protein Cmr5 n=1 Tax=Desulfonema limicola TaxID=45656 RepID=A0A975GGH2_9BACT|nr:type III-B CRISPR module-associated protein Cmr5 [Desulfonema limicola]QTA80262.1 Putative CRISPR type III-B/RAMP module RAMP protein Cmr5 [Desulfonema limicola]
MATIVQTIEQKRSAKAYFLVQEVAKKDAAVQEKYKTCAKNFPSMVLTNGLLQSLSFLLSKKADEEKGYSLVAEHVRTWIETAINDGLLNKPEQSYSVSSVGEMIRWLSSLDVRNYLTATHEVISFTPWLKRFAQGLLYSPS